MEYRGKKRNLIAFDSAGNILNSHFKKWLKILDVCECNCLLCAMFREELLFYETITFSNFKDMRLICRLFENAHSQKF